MISAFTADIMVFVVAVAGGREDPRIATSKRRQRQESLFIMADGLPKSAGHPFYQKLNALLAAAVFDPWIKQRSHVCDTGGV